MLQFLRTTSSAESQLFYLNIADEMTNVTYRPLITVTSQLTKNSKTFVATAAGYDNKDRYVILACFVVKTQVAENLTSGNIFLGNTDFPLGFYDVTIYQNTSNINLDPSGLTTIYTGLMNLRSNSTTDPVTYTEYTTNDADTESVYITI